MRISRAELAPVAGTTHPLRVARTMRGLSQRDVESLAHLPSTTLSHVECGRRGLAPEVQLRIARALNADRDALFPT